MKFFNRTHYPATEFACAGGKTTAEYGLELDADGNEHLKIIGERPIYEIIQAAAEGCNISSIITRWRAGDTSVLEQAAGVYGDFTNIPDNLAESHRAIISAQNYFNSLPLSEREKYGMNLNTFLGSFVDSLNNPIVNSETPAAAPAATPETITVDGVTYSINKEVAAQ